MDRLGKLGATIGATDVDYTKAGAIIAKDHLLNSYSGMAACTAGFVLLNNILIVAGNLVGASGIILTVIMFKAMNRSLANLLFSGFGSVAGSKATSYQGEAKAITPEDAYLILEAANSVLIVPGYGMAVAQAQHVVRELGELLTAKGANVRYGIHPVAGRMPGHMNVLLAEANVPYEQLAELQDINSTMSTMDVVMVIGANDVVNPAAREDKTARSTACRSSMSTRPRPSLCSSAA